MKPFISVKSRFIALLTLPTLVLSIGLHPQATHNASAPASSVKADGKQLVLESYGKLPIKFEANEGQTDPTVKFLTRGNGYTLFLTDSGATLKLRGEKQAAVLRMELIGAQPRVEGMEPLEGKVNYLIGNDKKKWHSNISTYESVVHRQAWEGIDLVWHGNQNELEYDFVVKPNADPSRILFALTGAQDLNIDERGNLVAQTPVGNAIQKTPTIYQDTNEGRQIIPGKFVLKGTNVVGFEIADYDRSRELVIDPVLSYSTYLGGKLSDEALGVSVEDSQGQAYITGKTIADVSFPTGNAIATGASFTVAFVTKLNANGSNFLYSTFLGNATSYFLEHADTCYAGNGFEICGTQGQAVAVGSGGEAVITGAVLNEDNDSTFPVTTNAFQDKGVGCAAFCDIYRDIRVVDAFVTMLKPDGSDLVYSTFYGGSALLPTQESGRAGDIGKSVAVDSANRIYISGFTASNDLPIRNGFQSTNHNEFSKTDAFVAVFDPRQQRSNDTLFYSSYLGGGANDQGLGIAVDNARNAYVVGVTASDDLKTKSPSSLAPLQERFQGGGFDGFVAKVATTASGNASLTYLTYFGGDINDRVESVAVDAAQRVYITGASNSSPDRFPLRNAFDSNQTNGEAFIAKMNADGTALFYCSFLGGANGNSSEDGEEGLGIAIDSAGNAYVTGRTTAGSTFPAGPVAPVFSGAVAGSAFITKIGASISSTTTPKLLYSTTFGGRTAKAEAITIDSKGNVYIAGSSGGDLPTTVGAFQPKPQGQLDGFVAKFASSFNDTIGVFRPSANSFQLRNSNSAGPADINIGFGIAGDLPVTGDWDGNGTDDVGSFRPSTGQFRLRIQGFLTITTITMNLGQNGDLPVAGDWNSDGIDTPGVFRPATGEWFLTDGPNVNNTSPFVNRIFVFGQAGDLPVVGDWNSDGIDTVGVFRGNQFLLSNSFQGTLDITPFVFGGAGDRPMAGDWDGDGVATIGVFSPGTGQMSLRNSNTSGNGDLVFLFGLNGDAPLSGDWDGKSEVPTN